MALILVIEDDPTQRLVTVGTLKTAGYEVIEASDGLRGLTMAGDYAPDLIVCDVQMPKMDGYAVVETLRQNPHTAEIPVVLVTALSDRAHVRSGMASGADDYLTKPYHARELCEVAASLMARREKSVFRTMSLIGDELSSQQKALAKRYEQQLVRELNERWATQSDGNGEAIYPQASVLIVDVFGDPLARRPAGKDVADAARHAYLTASDTLNLFGARHVLSHGGELMGIFVDRDDVDDPGAAQRQALRAAQALLRAATCALDAAAAPSLALTVALHRGPLTMLRVFDPLQGGDPVTLAVGETARAATAIHGLAVASGWRLAASGTAMDGIEDALTRGAAAELARGGATVPVAELLG